MIRRLLSRYHLRYIRSIVYIFQSSEYNRQEARAWHGRVQDFTSVERRKRLQFTPKAAMLVVVGWVSQLAVPVAVALWPFHSFLPTEWGYIASFYQPIDWVWYSVSIISAVALAPYIAFLSIDIVVGFMQGLIQPPIAAFLGRRARARLAAHPALKIAISGSYGKTSMRDLLATVLAERFNVAAPPSSYNTPLGVARFAKTLTGQEEVLLFECGEYYKGDITELATLIQPDVAIITGCTAAHLDKLGSLDQTAATVLELAEYVRAKTPRIIARNTIDKIFIHTDSKPLREFVRNNMSGVLGYSEKGCGSVLVKKIKSSLEGTEISISISKTAAQRTNRSTEVKLHTNLIGEHHAGAIAVVAEISLQLGLSKAELVQGMSKVVPFPHRMAPRTDALGVTFIDDTYNGNPAGVEAGIALLATIKNRNVWYVTPGIVELGDESPAIHERIAQRLITAKISNVLLVDTSASRHIANSLRAAKSNVNWHGTLRVYPDTPSVLNALPHLTTTNDVILWQNDWPDNYY